MPVIRPGILAALLALVLFPGTASALLRADTDEDKIFDSVNLSGSAPRPVLVALREPATATRLEAIEAGVGDLRHTTRLRLVDAFAGEATPDQIRALAARADVAHVEDDAVAVPFGVTAQRSFGVAQVRADLPGLDGQGLVAAVIDSGVDATMPDLAGGKVVAFKDLVNGRTAPYDEVGHGSLVSDILAGSGASGPEGRGVAPAASLVAINVIDGNGQSSLGLIAQGIQWAVEHRDVYGIDAINLSIGDPAGCGDGTDIASQAVDAAVAAGIVVVAAAGNAGPGSCTVKSPAAAESALTVGAMADTGAGGFYEGWFSSRGPTADGRIKPDVMAPGLNVVIAAQGGGTVLGSGTSAAAPFVTGTALLMLQAKPSLTPAAIKDAMERTAVDWGAPGRDNEYGSGRLDAYAAVEAVGAALATPPEVPSHRAWSGTLTAGDSATFDVDVAGAGFPLAVTLNAPSKGFGLVLRDASGASVGTMTVQPGPSRQGDLALKTPAAGHYTITVSAISDSGAWALDASGALAPGDETAPGLTVDELGPGHAGGTAGTALGDFPGVVLRVNQGGDEVRRIGAVPVLGRWSADFALPDGVYSVTAEQGDAGGNITRTPPQALTVDTTAPAAPSAEAKANGSTVLLSGSTEAGAKVEVREGGELRASTTAGGDGAWALSLPGVADGAHTYATTATDAAGNTSPATTRTVTVDTVVPAAPVLTAPSDGVRQASRTVKVEGTAEQAALVRVFDGGALRATVTAGASGHWTASFDEAADGRHAYTATATDAAGNASAGSAERVVWVDTVAPTVSIDDGPSGSVETRTALLTFSSGESGVTFACSLDGGAAGPCTSPATFANLADGAHAFAVRATDGAGNVGAVARREWHVAEAVVTPTPTATPAPLPAATPTAVPPVVTPVAPRPVIKLTLAKQRLATVVKRGLAVQVTCSCRVTLSLARGKTVLVRRTVGAGRVTLTLPAAARRALARTRRVTFTLTATSTGAKTVTARVTLSA